MVDWLVSYFKGCAWGIRDKERERERERAREEWEAVVECEGVSGGLAH